jgi:hypothetical protein
MSLAAFPSSPGGRMIGLLGTCLDLTEVAGRDSVQSALGGAAVRSSPTRGLLTEEVSSDG